MKVGRVSGHSPSIHCGQPHLPASNRMYSSAFSFSRVEAQDKNDWTVRIKGANSRVSTTLGTPRNTGHLLESEMPPGNTGNLEFNGAFAGK